MNSTYNIVVITFNLSLYIIYAYIILLHILRLRIIIELLLYISSNLR